MECIIMDILFAESEALHWICKVFKVCIPVRLCVTRYLLQKLIPLKFGTNVYLLSWKSYIILYVSCLSSACTWTYKIASIQSVYEGKFFKLSFDMFIVHKIYWNLRMLSKNRLYWKWMYITDSVLVWSHKTCIIIL